IDAGRMAPSAMNQQPWKFYVVKDRKIIASISAAIRKMAESFFLFSNGAELPESSDRIFYDAPLVIFLVGPKGDEWTALDIGMCAQNMMLAAKSLGLDTCPVGFAKFIMQTSEYSRLKLNESEQVYLALAIGYGDETPKVHERIKENVIYI
ncbi:MAG TPA: nitroreductase family protein, partial [Bacteroidia bacterium]|nr:nitroreductase family protein [Bacteroidia bacterium]